MIHVCVAWLTIGLDERLPNIIAIEVIAHCPKLATVGDACDRLKVITFRSNIGAAADIPTSAA